MRVWLVDVPAGASPPDLATARSLGPRGAVVARIKELLPGTNFETEGRGAFRRGAYLIDFRIDDPEPTRVEVDIDGGDGCVPLARIVEKTGWRVVDPEGPGFVDLEATRRIGVVVSVGQAEAISEGRDRSSPPSRRWMAVAAMAVLLGGWFIWSRAGSDSGGPVSEDGFAWPRQHIKQRHEQLAKLSPPFRNEVVVRRLIDFALAEKAYHAGVGRGRYATPQELGRTIHFTSLGLPAFVPPLFDVAAGDVYALKFHGTDCNDDGAGIPIDCESFVYTATPTDSRQVGQSKPPGYALYSSDMRIRHREHGDTPDLSDDTVDNGAAAEAGADAQRDAPGGWLSRAFSVFRSAAATREAVDRSESAALSDLREVRRAESEWRLVMDGEPKYMPPEQLADAGVFAKGNLPAPFLTSRFLQRRRDGYDFEFIGKGLTIAGWHADLFHPVYERFVYAARPAEPGPAGRRSFALYDDGSLFATTEQRVPTSQDSVVDAQ